MPVRPSPKKKSKIPHARPMAVSDRTAARMAKSAEFIAACGEQGVEPTRRQAARYNARQGRWASR